MQHITYNEFLPLVLPRSVMAKFDLLLQPAGYSQNYNTNSDPSIINGFAGAAYRFHSLVQVSAKFASLQFNHFR